MSHLPTRLLLGTGFALTLFLWQAPAAPAQPPKGKDEDEAAKVMQELLRKAEEEYRLFFKRPQQVNEYWAAIAFEMDVGKFDIAALLLDQLLKLHQDPKKEAKDQEKEKERIDNELLKIERALGLNAFLRLQEVRKWHDNAKLQAEAEKNVGLLIDRVTGALDRSLGDEKRIQEHIRGLTSERPEVRNFAFAELKRSKERASPYLLDALRDSVGTPRHEQLKSYVLRLDQEVLPPMLEALIPRGPKDGADVDLRYTLLDIMRRRDETRAVPYLWHLSAWPKHPPLIRAKAKETLASLLRVDEEFLPDARKTLTDLAERHYRHEVRFPDPRRVRVWQWDGKTLARQPVVLAAAQAEQYYGMLFADLALDLDPAYRPAQEVYLALTLERTFRDKLDSVLVRKLPDSVQRLLSTLDADLLLSALDRALNERNVAVALPLIRALGERGEFRAARSAGDGTPRGVVRGLYYPDRRVQMAAVNAVVRLPSVQEPVVTQRVVEMLGRLLVTDAVPKALVAYVPEERRKDLRKDVQAAGYEPVFAGNVREIFEKLHRSADIDLIVIHPAVTPFELEHLMGQLRGDSYAGLLPVVLLLPPDAKGNEERRAALARLAARTRNTWVLPEAITAKGDDFKGRLEEYVKLASAPAVLTKLPPAQREWMLKDLLASPGLKLSAAERRQFTLEAMDLIYRMSNGDLPGYDVRPVQPAVVEALANKDLANRAVEVLGRLPGVEVQQRLAGVALDPAREKLRLQAAVELNRHVRKHGVLLDRNQLAEVRRVAVNPKEDAALKAEFLLVLAQTQGSPRVSGFQLRNYVPDPPAKE